MLRFRCLLLHARYAMLMPFADYDAAYAMRRFSLIARYCIAMRY